MPEQLSPEELQEIAGAQRVINLLRNSDFQYVKSEIEEEVKRASEEVLDSEDLPLSQLPFKREFVRGLRFFSRTLALREEEAKDILRSHGLLEE